jgi:1-deoxy-D-xylulose-5-phosphate reductoisomerase
VGVSKNGGMRRRVAILGSTGSIGTQAIDVVAARPHDYEVVALAAGGGRPELLARQAIDLDVPLVAVSRASAAQDV